MNDNTGITKNKKKKEGGDNFEGLLPDVLTELYFPVV